jgi:hypothetical protein
MSPRQETVEKALGITLPPDYVDFLEEYGTYEADGLEIYGIDDEIVDINKIPCVIGATKILRKGTDLAKHFLVVQHTGYEDEIICLDTEAGGIYRISGQEQERIADSFR